MATQPHEEPMHGMIGLNRKGRKRKSGRRTASGRLATQPTIRDHGLVAEQPHRNWLPESLRGHERAGDMLGCLNLLNCISEHQYEAGRRFAVIVGAFRAMIGTPSGTAGCGRHYACFPELCARLRREDPAGPLCLCEDRTAKYRDACSYLQSAGQKAYNVTYQVVISEMIPSQEQMSDLTHGLAMLARGFGLGRR